MIPFEAPWQLSKQVPKIRKARRSDDLLSIRRYCIAFNQPREIGIYTVWFRDYMKVFIGNQTALQQEHVIITREERFLDSKLFQTVRVGQLYYSFYIVVGLQTLLWKYLESYQCELRPQNTNFKVVNPVKTCSRIFRLQLAPSFIP